MMKKAYVFENMNKAGAGACQLYATKAEALEDAEYFFQHLAASEKKALEECRVYEITADAEQIAAVEAGEAIADDYWSGDVWDACGNWIDWIEAAAGKSATIGGKLIEVGKMYSFGELWDGDGDGLELLESGAVSPDEENVVEFDVIEAGADPLDAWVRVTDIY